MEKLNPIFVKHGVQHEIAKALECTPQYVSLALKGKRCRDKALKIRYVALSEFNGVEIALTDEQKNKIMTE